MFLVLETMCTTPFHQSHSYREVFVAHSSPSLHGCQHHCNEEGGWSKHVPCLNKFVPSHFTKNVTHMSPVSLFTSTCPCTKCSANMALVPGRSLCFTQVAHPLGRHIVSTWRRWTGEESRISQLETFWSSFPPQPILNLSCSAPLKCQQERIRFTVGPHDKAAGDPTSHAKHESCFLNIKSTWHSKTTFLDLSFYFN